jgi:hypothetical protein
MLQYKTSSLAIEHPGIAVPVSNTYGSSRRILKQSSHVGEISIAYRVTGACITHVSDPAKTCTANCPTEDSWDNHQDGWRFHGGQVTGARVTDALGKTRRVAFSKNAGVRSFLIT